MTGGGKLLLRLLAVIALVCPVDLVIGPLSLSFLIHGNDACLPFWIRPGDVEANVGDGGGIGCWDSQSYSPNQYPSFVIVLLSCQSGLHL